MRAPRARRPGSAVLCAAVLAVTGCGGEEAPNFPENARRVDLQVVESPHGPGTLAFVPVRIAGEGPFRFALDTGASNSVIDRDVVEQVGLEVGERVGPVTGVTGRGTARAVEVGDWRIGDDVDMDGRTFHTIDLPDPENGSGLQGLLGSDVLSRFGTVTVDYDASVLLLAPRGG